MNAGNYHSNMNNPDLVRQQINGKLVIIGASDELIEVPTNLMLLGRRSLIGWPAGTSIDSQNTVSFSVLSDVKVYE